LGSLLKGYSTQNWFTCPQVVANLFEFLSSAEHKGRYFEERLGPNSCLAPLTFVVEKKKYYGSQWWQSSNRSSQYLSFCSAEERNMKCSIN